MVVYRTLTFRLSSGQRLVQGSEATRLLRQRNVVLFEGYASETAACPNRANAYYLGMLRWNDEEDFDVDPVFSKFKRMFCYEFASVACNDPERYFSMLEETLPKLPYPATKYDFFSAFPNDNVNKQRLEVFMHNEYFVKWVKENGSHDPQIFKNSLQGSELQNAKAVLHFEQAVGFVNEVILHKPILELCRSFVGLNPQQYMTPEESLQFVKNWCTFQGLDLKQFAVNWVHLMDRMVPKRNALFFQGEVSSGKNFIAESIIEASNFVGQLNNNEIHCPFAFDDCIRKRLIVLVDHNFDVRLSNQLMSIVEGSTVTICTRNTTLAFLMRTPVLILTQNPYWERYPQLQQYIGRRLVKAYTNLKPYGLMNERQDERKLHPAWLSLLIGNEKVVAPSTSSCQPAQASGFVSSSEVTIGIAPSGLSVVPSLPVGNEESGAVHSDIVRGPVADNGPSVSRPILNPGSGPITLQASNDCGIKVKKEVPDDDDNISHKRPRN